MVFARDFVLVRAAACFFSSFETCGVSRDWPDLLSTLLRERVDVTRLMAMTGLDAEVAMVMVMSGANGCSVSDDIGGLKRTIICKI